MRICSESYPRYVRYLVCVSTCFWPSRDLSSQLSCSKMTHSRRFRENQPCMVKTIILREEGSCNSISICRGSVQTFSPLPNVTRGMKKEGKRNIYRALLSRPCNIAGNESCATSREETRHGYLVHASCTRDISSQANHAHSTLVNTH